MSSTPTAEEFLAEAEAADPERYKQLAERFPVSTEYDDFRFKWGEPRERTLRRRGPSNGVPRPMRRRPTDEEVAARHAALREMRLDYSFAKELADSGF